MRRALALAAVTVALLIVVGCGGDDGEPSAEPTTEPTTTELTVYFLLYGKVWPVRRLVGYTPLVERAALDALTTGPTDQELEDFMFSNEPYQATHRTGALFPSHSRFQAIAVEGDVVHVEVPHAVREDGVAQLVFTLTQFPGIRSVELVTRTLPPPRNGPETRVLKRADFEMFTPAILVESPLAYNQVTGPLRVTGTANTFEATFSYELKDASGRVLAEDFVTATSGTGTRGTFELEVPYAIPEDVDGTLVVFERSAKDGSRINVVEIPLRLTT